MYKRHDLVTISQEGRYAACKYACEQSPHLDQETIRQLILSDVPAIVRRQEHLSDDELEVGFASHLYHNGNRLRVASRILRDSVTSITTPFEVIQRLNQYPDIPKQEVFSALIDAANQNCIKLGVYGSTALEIVTGLPYRHETSDLDLYLQANPSSDLDGFYKKALEIQEAFGAPLDMEIEVKNIYGVKVKELFSHQKTVLAKGFYDVQIFMKADLDQELTRSDAH